MAVSVAPDLPDQQDAHQTIAFVQELFNEASRAKRALIPQWNRFYRLSRNRAWSEYRASWLPSPSSSEIFPTIHCVPEEAEALTQDGWKTWDQCAPDDRFLTYDVATDAFEWQQASGISVFPFDGKLQNIRGFLATEDHRWPARDSRDGHRRIRRGYDLKSGDQLIQAAGSHGFPADSVLSPRDAAILGWIVTDGTFAFQKNQGRTPRAWIYQAPRKFLREIAALLGDEATVRTTTRQARGLVNGSFPTAVVNVRAKALYRLTAAGFTGKDNLLPIITRLSREAAEAMWDAMLKAEGHSRKDGCVVFCQNPGPVFDAFQVLSLVLGYRVNQTPDGKHHVGGFRSGRREPQHGRFIGVQQIAYEHYEGRVWCPTTPNSTWVMRQNGKVVVTGNTIASYMTAQRPRLFPTPYLEDEQVQVDPQVLGEKAEQMKLTLESWWTTAKAARACRMSIWDMLTFGAGCLKTGWDPSLHDGLGDATVRRVDPYNLLPDPTASCEDDLRYMLEASEVPVYELKLRFPRTAHLVDGSASPDLYHLDRRPDMRGDYEVVPQGQLAGIQRTGEFPGTATTGIPSRFTWPGAGYRKEDFTRKARLVECWIRESDTVTIPVITGPDHVEEMSVEVPTWRFVAVAGGKLLTDMDNPFPHNQLPYVRIPYVETGEFWPPPLVEHLDRAQIALNRLLASLQMNIELAGNPILVDQVQSGLSRTRISNRPGGRLTEQVPGAIRWLQPPSVSGEMLAAVQNWRESIDRTSGISAVTRGEALRRREPAQAVDTAHEAAATRIGDVLTNLEEALRRLANQTAANIGQWYIEPRQIPVAGARGGPNMLELPPKAFRYPIVEGTKVRDVPISFEVWIEAGSSLPLSHQARVAEMMSLFFAGLVDPQAVHEVLDLPGWKEIVQRLQAAPPPPNPRRR